VIVLGVLMVSWIAFRLAGRAGVRSLATWRDAGRWALAVMLMFTAAAHFTSARHDLVQMIPAWMPQPYAVIYLTGILEIAGAVGLLIPRTRSLAGICLCLLFAAMFAANVKAAQDGLMIAGSPATPLVWRLPMQILFIWLAWWSSRTARQAPTSTSTISQSTSARRPSQP
jgi:uncharacterized membrane protein